MPEFAPIDENQENSYQDVLKEIDVLLTEENLEQQSKAIEQYTNQRLAELTSVVKPVNISIQENPFYKGFIHPESKIKRSFIVDPFQLDDQEIYSHLIKNIGEIKASPGWNEKTTRVIIPTAVLYTVAKYFGNFVGYQDTDAKNREFYMDKTTTESDSVSIKELEGKGIAVCAEKAALSQNLLSFMGIDSTLVFSDKCQFDGEKEGLHAFNIVHTENGFFIFDPTNPEQHRDAEGKLANYLPNFYPISNEQYQSLQESGTVEVQHKDYETVDGVSKAVDSKRIY